MERFSRLLDDLYFTNSTNAKEAIFLVIKTLANLDFSKPCGFLERAKDLGFSTDELKNMKSAIIKSKGVIEDIEDSSVRDNLYVLKYNSHTSAVALDVTPSPLIKIQAPIVKSMLDFFIKYHINTTQQFISVLRNAKDWGSTISGMASYSLMGMPANMALNYMMGCIYHGGTYNPFDSYKDGMAFVGESMLGQVSRIPMMVLASFTGDKAGSNPISNPLFTEIGNIFGGAYHSKLKSSILSNSYYYNKDESADIYKLVKAISGITPFGQLGLSSYKFYQNNSN